MQDFAVGIVSFPKTHAAGSAEFAALLFRGSSEARVVAALSDSSHLNGEEQLSNGRLPSLNGAAGSGAAEAPRTVVCRDGPEPSAGDVPEDEDLPADLRRMLSAAMKELGSSRPGSPPEETQPSC
ncbi:unnamed protein product [Ixodes pacificus]